jgi:hypothetical protein
MYNLLSSINAINSIKNSIKYDIENYISSFSLEMFFYNVLYYIIFIIIILYVMYILYFKIKYPFWSKQPVFHFHNIKEWIKPSGVLYVDGQFPKNKYYTPFEVAVENYNDVEDNIKTQFYGLIQNHYMTSKDSSYYPSNDKINAYFVGHNYPCFLSYINKKYLDYNVNTIQNNIVCALTSRPIHIYIQDVNDTIINNENTINTNINTNKYLLMNYVDFLCTHKNERKKNHAPKTIYTYAIESQKTKPNTNLFIFKREGVLNAIVPVITYTTYMYDLQYWNTQTITKPYSLIQISDSNFDLIRKSLDILQLQKYFKLVGISNISNIYELVKSKCILIYALTIPKTDFVFSLYFFKDNDVTLCENREKNTNYKIKNKQDDDKQYDDKEKVIECIGSIFYSDVFSKQLDITEKKALFENGFHNCIHQIKKRL